MNGTDETTVVNPLAQARALTDIAAADVAIADAIAALGKAERAARCISGDLSFAIAGKVARAESALWGVRETLGDIAVERIRAEVAEDWIADSPVRIFR